MGGGGADVEQVGRCRSRQIAVSGQKTTLTDILFKAGRELLQVRFGSGGCAHDADYAK